jgi:ATP diphosphatase
MSDAVDTGAESPNSSAQSSSLGRLQDVVERLIAPDGCPWDREQTPLSLCEYVLEEAQELVEAIRHGSDADVCEELGDVLFLLTFIGRLYAGKGGFTLDTAMEVNAAKMIRRHPHVFAGEVFASLDEQLAAWERIKRSEKTDEEGRKPGVFDSLPKNLPPLTKAYRIHAKAARAGFTWDSDQDVEQQVEAEWLELLDAFSQSDKDKQEHELGDLLFTLVELGRRRGLKASAALDFAAQRFLRRFAFMEAEAAKHAQDFAALDMEEKNALWDKAKEAEKGK